jgi:hypothetical protein
MFLLFRGYARSRVRLLFLSALFFCFLSVDNVWLFVDMMVLPTVSGPSLPHSIRRCLRPAVAEPADDEPAWTPRAWSMHIHARELGFVLIL